MLKKSRLPKKHRGKNISTSSDEDDIPLAKRTIRKKKKKTNSKIFLFFIYFTMDHLVNQKLLYRIYFIY